MLSTRTTVARTIAWPSRLPFQINRWRARAMLFSLWLALTTLASAQAAELVVVEQSGCPYCEQFDAEIAPAWPNTEEGRTAPLRRVDLHEPWPTDLAGIKRASLTPTFILVQDGQEVGRLIGYRGDEHFWFLVGELLAELDE